MSNYFILIPPFMALFALLIRGYTLFFKKPSLRAIEIQNKYRAKKGVAPMSEEDVHKLFSKHRIIGVVLALLGVAQFILVYQVLPIT